MIEIRQLNNQNIGRNPIGVLLYHNLGLDNGLNFRWQYTRVFNVYLIVAFLLTVCRIYYKFHICKNLVIAYLLPVLAIILCAVIADQYECSIRRGEKRLECLRNSQQT